MTYLQACSAHWMFPALNISKQADVLPLKNHGTEVSRCGKCGTRVTLAPVLNESTGCRHLKFGLKAKVVSTDFADICFWIRKTCPTSLHRQQHFCALPVRWYLQIPGHVYNHELSDADSPAGRWPQWNKLSNYWNLIHLHSCLLCPARLLPPPSLGIGLHLRGLLIGSGGSLLRLLETNFSIPVWQPKSENPELTKLQKPM